MGTIGARLGIHRTNYRITPGVYAIGNPDKTSPVIVTANYKLTVDCVRSALSGLALWLLVIDTRGINVWCAAGKKTFCADEIIYQVKRTQLNDVVSHRRLILPQLSAPGVKAMEVKKQTGFEAVFGPVRIADMHRFLQEELPTDDMREVTFSFMERIVLVPVELTSFLKPFIFISVIITFLSGISPDIYSAKQAIDRGSLFTLMSFFSLITATSLTAALLPWLPGRQFWIKGLFLSIFTGPLFLLFVSQSIHTVEKAALLLWLCSATSFLAMNFTGSTPYTSLSGVEKEMKSGLLFQILVALIATILWIAEPFFSGNSI